MKSARWKTIAALLWVSGCGGASRAGDDHNVAMGASVLDLWLSGT